MALCSYYKHFPVYGILAYSRLCCNLSNPHCFRISVKIHNSKVAIVRDPQCFINVYLHSIRFSTLFIQKKKKSQQCEFALYSKRLALGRPFLKYGDFFFHEALHFE